MARNQLAGVDLRPRLDIDAEVRLADLTWDFIRDVQRLAPFGQGNQEPVFLCQRVEVVDCRTMGNNNGHLRWKLRQGNTTYTGVSFGLGSYLPEVASPLDIVFNLEIDRWGGEERLRLNVLDFAPAKSG